MSDTKTFPTAFLINGEDALAREKFLVRLRERAAAYGDIDFNCDAFDGETALGGEIVDACNTVPFASEIRLVIVQNADRLKKADAEELVSYLKSPCESTVLALVAEKLAKNTRLYKAAAASGPKAVIDCSPVKSWELPKKVREMATGHGITLTPSAASLLVELVGENTVHLDAELKKLALSHTAKQSIGDAEIRALVMRSAEAKPWDFTAAFAERDLAAALKILSRLDSSSPYSLLGMTVTRVRELISYHALARRGQSSAKAFAAAMKMPEWKVKNHPAWAKKWSAAELRAALSSARDTERAMKSQSDADVLFRDWVIRTMAGH